MPPRTSPQNGGPKRMALDPSVQNQIQKDYQQRLMRQVVQRIELEQEAAIPQPKKKGWIKRGLPYLVPALGTGAAAGLPFLF